MWVLKGREELKANHVCGSGDEVVAEGADVIEVKIYLLNYHLTELKILVMKLTE